MEDERCCRICYGSEDDDDNMLINPCRCMASTGWVHRKCLSSWERQKKKCNSSNYLICDICLSNYNLLLPPKPTFLRIKDASEPFWKPLYRYVYKSIRAITCLYGLLYIFKKWFKIFKQLPLITHPFFIRNLTALEISICISVLLRLANLKFLILYSIIQIIQVFSAVNPFLASYLYIEFNCTTDIDQNQFLEILFDNEMLDWFVDMWFAPGIIEFISYICGGYLKDLFVLRASIVISFHLLSIVVDLLNGYYVHIYVLQIEFLPFDHENTNNQEELQQEQQKEELQQRELQQEDYIQYQVQEQCEIPSDIQDAEYSDLFKDTNIELMHEKSTDNNENETIYTSLEKIQLDDQKDNTEKELLPGIGLEQKEQGILSEKVVCNLITLMDENTDYPKFEHILQKDLPKVKIPEGKNRINVQMETQSTEQQELDEEYGK